MASAIPAAAIKFPLRARAGCASIFKPTIKEMEAIR